MPVNCIQAAPFESGCGSTHNAHRASNPSLEGGNELAVIKPGSVNEPGPFRTDRSHRVVPEPIY